MPASVGLTSMAGCVPMRVGVWTNHHLTGSGTARLRGRARQRRSDFVVRWLGLGAAERLGPPEQIDARAGRGTNDRTASAPRQPTLIGETAGENQEPIEQRSPPRKARGRGRAGTQQTPQTDLTRGTTQVERLSTTDKLPPRLGDPAG